ncbi:MAG: 16S rRNA (cytosine(1402)-N(4))-methyltransferase RsmH [Gracilibacteraceae bacterium]|nr:16S rRNA (cytosine(1402)-N(4))-methyltransferase RsmH [Gracilibacteraceae bacterium]
MTASARFAHTSVLGPETVSAVLGRRDGVYVDATLGGGGHSALLLRELQPAARLVGLDKDEWAIAHCRERFAADERVILRRRDFRQLGLTLAELGFGTVDGVMADLGLSSPQVDEAERGFSYNYDAPLDMRMDRGQTLTARAIVNEWPAEELRRILRLYGEEKWAARIAAHIAEARRAEPILTTGRLAALIKEAIPAAARRTGPHPAKRSFQALRIAVNDELAALAELLEQAFRLLGPAGRLAVVTFHSLEDRIVKQRFAGWQGRCVCPPGLPLCVCGARTLARAAKPVLPGRAEIEANPRARSAKLRSAIKTVDTREELL